jgi:hypothetical protein
MSHTLVINTPDASRNAFRAVQVILNHYGFEVPRLHPTITDGGQCIVAHVIHCAGETEYAAREVERVLPKGSTLAILH